MIGWLEQKWLTPRNKKEFMKIAFQIFVNLSLLSKELLLAVYMYLERETRVNHTFVPCSFPIHDFRLC